MTEQPEALRLADLIQSRYGNDINDEAAAELRRLNDLLGKSRALNRIRSGHIRELEKALGMAVEFIEANTYGGPDVSELLATARQTLGGKHD